MSEPSVRLLKLLAELCTEILGLPIDTPIVKASFDPVGFSITFLLRRTQVTHEMSWSDFDNDPTIKGSN